MKDMEFIAKQYNRFMQMSVQSANLPDEQAMEIADLYPDWNPSCRFLSSIIFHCLSTPFIR